VLTADRLREVLTYAPEDGNFYWLKPPGNKMKPGDLAGSRSSSGYTQIRLDSGVYLAHRLIYLYTYGLWPRLPIDHRDGDKRNNKWNNLRLAKPSQNAQNSRISANNTSGAKGVSASVATRHAKKPWVAYIVIDYKKKHLGYFETLEEARAAREKAELELFGEFSPLATKGND